MAIRPVAIAVLAASCWLAGCVTEDASPNQGSGSTDETVRERISSFDSLKGQEYLDNVNLLAGLLKDRAYPMLVDSLANSPSDKVRAGCASALYMGQDDRAREHLARAAMKDANPGVRFTAAYGLCLYRDSRGLPILFEALRSDNSQWRWDANDRLKGVTGLDFAFDTNATPELREAAVARWEAWYKRVGPAGASQALMPVTGRPR